jgi:hypothetical protein
MVKPNNGMIQNFPVLTSARKSNSTSLTTISGRLDSNPTQLFEVQCFLTDGAPASGYGEGSNLLATAIVSTDTSGDGRFSCESRSWLIRPSAGQTVSATATNLLTGDTSEFSKNKAIVAAP